MLALAGCASRYHEPPRSNGQTAELVAASPVWIVSIDGKKVSSIGFSGFKSLVVAAGSHVVDLQYSRVEHVASSSWNSETYRYTQGTHHVPVKFTAIADRSYFAEAQINGDVWRPYITDHLHPVFQDPGAH
jgi:hypothetical protein